jgi:hypothetical protein
MQKFAVQSANTPELGIIQRPTVSPNDRRHAPSESVKLPLAEHTDMNRNLGLTARNPEYHPPPPQALQRERRARRYRDGI